MFFDLNFNKSTRVILFLCQDTVENSNHSVTRVDDFCVTGRHRHRNYTSSISLSLGSTILSSIEYPIRVNLPILSPWSPCSTNMVCSSRDGMPRTILQELVCILYLTSAMSVFASSSLCPFRTLSTSANTRLVKDNLNVHC